jgi:hypothetical protein
MEKEGMSVKEIRKQAEITAKEIIERLKNSVEHGFMTYPELVRILRHSLKKTIDEMCLFRAGEEPPLSLLKKLGLKDLYEALEEIEKKEAQEIKEKKRRKKSKIVL